MIGSTRVTRRRDDAVTARADDAGSASIWVLAFATVVLAAASSMVVIGGAIADRHRAATAADLAALAGAAAVAQAAAGEGTTAGELPGAGELRNIGCTAAGAIADANAAHLLSCDVVGATVAVAASVKLSRLAQIAALAGTSVTASARAGPE